MNIGDDIFESPIDEFVLKTLRDNLPDLYKRLTWFEDEYQWHGNGD